MQPILTQLDLVDKKPSVLKEQLFEWIVNMTQGDFDQLCNEIIGVQRFWEKYSGVLVTDRLELIRPFISLLPKVELVIEIDERSYNRNHFYRWLSTVNVYQLQSICFELETMCDLALENANTYVVAAISPVLQKQGACWRIEQEHSVYLNGISSAIQNWKS
jgi:hypothetical protein